MVGFEPRWLPAFMAVLLGASTASLAATVNGKVRMSFGPGSALEGARVTLFLSDLSFFREVRTGADGRYSLTGVAPGAYRLGASKPLFEYREVGITVSEPSATADLLLGPESHAGRWTVIGSTDPEPFGATNSGTLQPDGKIFFCHDTLDPVLFDPVTGETTLPPGSPSYQGCHHPTVLADGRVIFVGGQESEDFTDATRTVKTWDPASGIWTVLPSLNEERWYPGLTRLASGRLLACGGGQSPDAQRTETCEIFDPDTQLWTATGSMGTPTEFAPSVLLFSGEVLLTWYPPQLFDPQGELWRNTGNLLQPRDYPQHSDHSLVLLPDGRPMAVGIRNGAHDAAMTEIYDPVLESWSLGPSPVTLRSQPEVVLLPGGRVLAAGGKKEDGDPVPTNPWGYVALADLYEPALDSWRPMANMTVAREYHATSLLVPDGRVVTTGGTGAPGGPGGSNNSVEAFEPPYLFRGVRPRIDSLSSAQLCAGQSVQLQVSFAADVSEVLLLGTMAVTHWVDASITRHLALPFSQSGSELAISVPDDPVQAPQGWYILFAMVDDVPSEGRIVRLTHSVPTEVASLTVVGKNPTVLSWSPALSSGLPLIYEVATGLLDDLGGPGKFGLGECLAGGVPGSSFEDTRAAPPGGEGYYYMVRARNACFAGTYGSALRDEHGSASGLGCP